MSELADLQSPEGGPRIYPAIGLDDLDLHVTCECGWLIQLSGGQDLWEVLMLVARHWADRHDDVDVQLVAQLAQLLQPAIAAREASCA